VSVILIANTRNAFECGFAGAEHMFILGCAVFAAQLFMDTIYLEQRENSL
jgi:anti-sigma regulatory factor (Ser/Thr protein kinase)